MSDNETQQCRDQFEAYWNTLPEPRLFKEFAWSVWTASRQEGRRSDEKLKEFATNLAANQKPLEPEFAKVLQDNYWELLEQSNPASTKPDTAAQTLEKLMPLLQQLVGFESFLRTVEMHILPGLIGKIAAIINGNGREG